MKGIKIRIINLNNLEVDDGRDINIDDNLIKPIQGHLEHLKNDFGLDISLSEIYINNSFKFNNWIVNELFAKEYKIFDKQNINKGTSEFQGIPDFELINKETNETIYLEIKINSDTLRESQLTWMLDSIKQKKKVMIMFIKTSVKTKDKKDNNCNGRFNII